MKKTLLLIAALLMMGSAVFAQGDDIAIGVKAGYQTARLSYDEANVQSDFSNHFTLGLYGRITAGRLYLQPEILYFKTSNVFDASVTGTDNGNLFNLPTGANVNVTLNQMNLQVPIMVGYNLVDLDAIALRVQVGPTANFVLKSQTLYDETYTLNEEPIEIEDPEATPEEEFDTRSIAWGLQAGIGVDLMKRFTFDINYNIGMSKMFEALNGTALGETFNFGNIDSTKQNTFMVTMGIKLF